MGKRSIDQRPVDVKLRWLAYVDTLAYEPYNASQCCLDMKQAMKLLVFVTDDTYADATIDALVTRGFRVTRLATTGGVLRKGNTTLLVGVEDGLVERATAIVRQTAPGTLVFTLDLERYEHL